MEMALNQTYSQRKYGIPGFVNFCYQFRWERGNAKLYVIVRVGNINRSDVPMERLTTDKTALTVLCIILANLVQTTAAPKSKNTPCTRIKLR